MEASAAQRLSRWDRSPLRNSQGAEKLARLTARDHEVFKLLARYRYLPADFIHAFVGGSLKGLSRHLSVLKRKPNCYIACPEQQRQSAAANHRHLIYQLDVRGADTLRAQGISVDCRSHRNFAHEVMACEILASLELGTLSQPTCRLITWAEITQHPRFPEATRRAPHPHACPVSFTHRDSEHSFELYADCLPFGIERPHNGRAAYIFCPGIEADTRSEPIEPSDFERSSIYRKFAGYLSLIERETYKTRWALPILFVPFITTTERRMRSMMACLERLTNGVGSSRIIFTTCPGIYSFDQPLRPDGSMLTRKWQRVGHPPFSFIEQAGPQS
jgi:hypothetical protein